MENYNPSIYSGILSFFLYLSLACPDKKIIKKYSNIYKKFSIDYSQLKHGNKLTELGDKENLKETRPR